MLVSRFPFSLFSFLYSNLTMDNKTNTDASSVHSTPLPCGGARGRVRIIVLTGAGMSAESGISTFRDSGGLW